MSDHGIELREFKERQDQKTTEILVSAARKRPYLDFVHDERSEEARLSRELKTLRSAVNHVLSRIERATAWAGDKSSVYPAHFELRRNQAVEPFTRLQPKYMELREKIMNEALAFEESRRQLRWIYDTVQKMRVVQDVFKPEKTLLDRIINFGKDEALRQPRAHR